MRKLLPVLVALGLIVTACSGDDDTTAAPTTDSTTSVPVDVIDDTTPEPDPIPEDPTGTGLVCVPAGEPVAEADGVLDVSAREWGFELPSKTVSAGNVFVSFSNGGDQIHELKITKLDSLDDVPTEADGSVDESKLEIFEPLGPIGTGDSCEGTYKMDPGTYVLFSDLISDTEGAYFELGVSAVVTVE